LTVAYLNTAYSSKKFLLDLLALILTFLLYLNIHVLRKSPGQFVMGVLEKFWIFLLVEE